MLTNKLRMLLLVLRHLLTDEEQMDISDRLAHPTYMVGKQLQKWNLKK